MEKYKYHSKTEPKLCKKTLILVASIVLVISSAIYFTNISNANSEIVEIASISSSKLLNNDISLVKDQLISIYYKPINVPNDADIRIFSNDLNNMLVYTANQVDLSQRLSYSFSAELVNGVYAAIISSSEIVTKVIPFSITSDKETIIDLGSFELHQNQELTDSIADNGVVNALDFQIDHL